MKHDGMLVADQTVPRLNELLLVQCYCRSYRKQLWDENGEWLQQEPESAQALQRLLCRPLKHLWQDSPEARGRAGDP